MPTEQKDIQKKNTVYKSDTTSYRSIFKATSLFGGVQVYQIIISIIKSKFVAILLGPTGVGIQGLYTSATQLIQSLSSFGLKQSSVKNVSEAYATGDNLRVSLVITVLRKLVWFTGLLGMFLVIIFSPRLSHTTFGSYDYIIPLIILSVTLLLDQLCAGQKVLLQGTRKLKDLAKASAIGTTLGLLVSVPLYYFLGLKGVVPTLILNSLTALLLSWYFSRKIVTEKVSVDFKTVLKEGKGMIQMGIAMSISGILVHLSSYILRSFIRQEGGVDAVGLFSAGYMIMSTYAGLVFSAMGTDYYPRLSAVNKDNKMCRTIMNQQAEIGMLILSPLVALCIVYIPIVVRILYSSAFLPANNYIVWAAAGMLFKMASWSISFVFVAKGETRLFIINEVCSNIYTLGLNILGYYLGGLTGLGIAFMLGYLFYSIQVYLISHIKYGFSFSLEFIKLFVIQSLLVASCVAIIYLSPSAILKYIIGTVMAGISILYSLKGLDKRIGLRDLIVSKIKNNG